MVMDLVLLGDFGDVKALTRKWAAAEAGVPMLPRLTPP